MGIRLRQRWVRLVALCVALFGLVAGVAFATATVVAGTDATNIQACANQTNGMLRVVSGASDCREGEQFLTWPAQSGGGTLAYAHVSKDGLDAARSKNITSVTLMPGDLTGYCIDIDDSVAGEVKNVVAQYAGISPYPNGSAAELASTNPPAASFTGCPDTTDAYITSGLKWSSPIPYPYYVLFN